MISRRQIISRSTGRIFAIFTSNESFLDVDDRSGPLFSICQGKLPWQPILCKNGAKLPTHPALIALSIQNGMGYRYLNGCVNSANDACILCENFVKFGRVTPELTGLICERVVWRGQKMGLFGRTGNATLGFPVRSHSSRNSLRSFSRLFSACLVFGYTGRIFAIFSPYESALRADDGSVPYFPICRGMFRWQPNNFAIIKANW